MGNLRGQLDASEESRVAREREFLKFTQGISKLGVMAGTSVPTFDAHVPAEDESDAARGGTDTAAAASDADASTSGSDVTSDAGGTAPIPLAVKNAPRSREIFLGLRALLVAEQVQGIDLLESGNLQEGFVGPIVMRVMDARGRPMGSLTAERLRLEASRAARMVTIVLEQGCERRDGERVPFEGGPVDEEGRAGRRRIVLADCDPRPWMEAFPELFPALDLDARVDDGRHDLGRLRATLNTLLYSEAGASRETGAEARAAAGWYRLQGLGGVQGVVLRDVALDQVDRDGRIERRFFADRMRLVREEQGLQILLEGGSQVRSDQKTPFLDGRYRIFLPRARMSAWEKAGLPGLAPLDTGHIPPAPVHPAPVTPSPAPEGSDSKPAVMPPDETTSPSPRGP